MNLFAKPTELTKITSNDLIRKLIDRFDIKIQAIVARAYCKIRRVVEFLVGKGCAPRREPMANQMQNRPEAVDHALFHPNVMPNSEFCKRLNN